jgi:hypothetical protein
MLLDASDADGASISSLRDSRVQSLSSSMAVLFEWGCVTREGGSTPERGNKVV